MRLSVIIMATMMPFFLSSTSMAQDWMGGFEPDQRFYVENDASDVKATLQELLTKNKKHLLPVVAIHTNSQTFTGQLLQITENMVVMIAAGTPEPVYNSLPMGVNDPVDTYHYIALKNIEAFSVETVKSQ